MSFRAKDASDLTLSTPGHEPSTPVTDERTLADLGERRIRDEVVLPRLGRHRGVVVGPGDDAAVVALAAEDRQLVFTTDPCPYPVASLVGSPDLYHAGWLTVLINVSDLGAMGATPRGILISLTMPEDMPVRDLERFYDGAVAAATRWSCPILGGNIKDGHEFTATGSAIGVVTERGLMRRNGVVPGDVICIYGEIGLFWAAVTAQLLDLGPAVAPYKSAFTEALIHPTAKLEDAQLLANTDAVHAATDASDGLGGALRELATASDVDISVEDIVVSPAVRAVSSLARIDVRNLALAWGDWQLVVSVAPRDVGVARAVAAKTGTAFATIGVAQEGSGEVIARDDGGSLRPIRLFASDRFTRGSYFTHGLEAYLEMLREPHFV